MKCVMTWSGCSIRDALSLPYWITGTSVVSAEVSKRLIRPFVGDLFVADVGEPSLDVVDVGV